MDNGILFEIGEEMSKDFVTKIEEIVESISLNPTQLNLAHCFLLGSYLIANAVRETSIEIECDDIYDV